jgi:aspartate/methionine/tyrosine aminotransferase
VSPNNPTGSFVTAAEIARLGELCGERSLALIGDEVFADYSWTEATPASVLEQGAALTFSLGGLSKSAGLPQLKLGWIAIGGPAAVVADARERLEIICDMYLSVGTPVQLALPDLIDRGARIRDQIRIRIATNRAALAAALRDAPACRALHADGAWCATLRIPAARAEEDIVVDLVEKDGVVVHPGYFFDFPFDGILVVSLLPRPDDFARGIASVCRRA